MAPFYGKLEKKFQEHFKIAPTLQQLRQIAPPGQLTILQGIITGWGLLAQYSINTPIRVQYFLAQNAHESDSFKTTKEYASGAAYEGRLDLGNTQPGDGVRFKGRGLTQLTGRANYEAYSKASGIDYVSNPAKLEQMPDALAVSCWFWQTHGCNELSDQKMFLAVTKRINGGYNGLQDREAFLARIQQLNIGP